MSRKSSTNSTCKVTPTSKYDNGVAKNFVRVQMSRSESKTSQVTALRDALQTQLNSINDKLNYYQILQNNLDIFETFDYRHD